MILINGAKEPNVERVVESGRRGEGEEEGEAGEPAGAA